MGTFVTYSLVCIFFLLPVLCYSNQSYASKATFYKTSDGKGTPNGACGYGDYGKYVNNGLVTAASSKLYNNGVSCGACYMVTCKYMALCSYQGTKVVVTDNGEGPAGSDFILSYDAFGRLAKHPGLAQKLFAKGVVDVDYKRVSCNYGNNLAFKINEHSNYPGYIALVPINQGGATDILAIQLYEEKSYKWIGMRRAYGAVFDLANPPSGPLKLRIQVSDEGGNMTKWVHPKKTIIPSYWKPGTIIQTDIQLP